MAKRFRLAALPLLLMILGTVALSLIPGSSAQAHDRVSEQFPTAGERCDTAPDAVRLTFTEEPLALGAVVVVVDAENGNWSIGEPQIDGRTVTQAIAAGMPDGHYQVRWRVVSSDGHPTSESFLFSVGDTSNAAAIMVPDGAAATQAADATQTADATQAADATRLAAAPDLFRPGSPTRAFAVAAAGAVLAVSLYWVAYIRPARSLPTLRKTE